jgi:FkbM family methyltransferase
VFELNGQNQYRWIKILAITILALALTTAAFTTLLRAHPGLALLVRPGLKSRTQFCSIWRAIPDFEIQVRQEETMDRLHQENRMLRRESDVTLWQTTSGQYWVPSSDDLVLPVLQAQSARGIYGTGARDVQPGDVVLDVGAYVGTYTRHAIERGAKLVVAIEPSPTSVECLRRNLATEIAAGKVIVYPKGIWDSEDLLTLFVNPKNTAGNTFLPFGEKSVSIPVTTISKVVRELNLPRVDFIKTDVKGATERLLRGGTDVIARDQPRMALSTEEVDVDDAGAIAALAKKIQPAYEVTPGPCLVKYNFIYTDVMFFR